MTLGLSIDDSIESRRFKITPAAIVSLIARTALACGDDDSIPDDVLDDLIERFHVEDEKR